jgi:hypothetical protein
MVTSINKVFIYIYVWRGRSIRTYSNKVIKMISHFLQQETISNQTTVFSFVASTNPQRQTFEQGDQMIFLSRPISSKTHILSKVLYNCI